MAILPVLVPGAAGQLSWFKHRRPVMVIRKGKGKVTFVFEPKSGFTDVSLVGTFNNWEPDGFKMARQKDGTYRKQITLPPGEYQYKFLADGQWLTDPSGEGFTVNEFGTKNSTLCVR
jgi:1,4-alpha-glucan branching enzyme